jgi:exodeoxyribonuclease VII large subunit
MQARGLKFRPEDGMRVIARGRIGLYDVKGEYQIVCDTIEPHGLGALQAAFEQLKRQLKLEGLFEAARKRPLPVLPRRIGVITSLDGAAVRDVVRILMSRHPTARVVVRAARVQGDGAAADLIRALRALSAVEDIDVIIIGRGGGSAEDLWAFNDEGLARAIAACPVPVISAVGHEVDFTIADFVADMRAATPSNAAELVVERADHFSARIDRATARLRLGAEQAVALRQHAVHRLTTRLEQWPAVLVMRDRDRGQLHHRLERLARQRVARLDQRFSTLRRRLEARDLGRVCGALRTRLVGAEARLREAAVRGHLHREAHARTVAARLDALSPLAVLGRGYAVCWNAARDGIIRSANAVRPGDQVHVTLAQGNLSCRVERTDLSRPDV